MTRADAVVGVAERLRVAVDKLHFELPVTHVYNPLDYAWPAHETYLRRYARGRKRVLFLGMNPGPFGMAQTGVPFGQVNAVRDWLRIRTDVGHPPNEHPKRRVSGFACQRNKISGERLWGLFASRFGQADEFSREHLVMNYCPLAFLEGSGRNRTPDKLPVTEQAALFSACDEHLSEINKILRPEWVIGIGSFATRQAQKLFPGENPRVGRILHPSPASPAANADWAGRVTTQLQELGVW